MKCGGNYLISVKDTIVTEQKIKTLSLIKFSKLSLESISAKNTESDSPDEELVADIADHISFSNWPTENDGFILLYVSGYIARSSSGQCEACNAILCLDEGLPQIDSLSTQFFENLDRRGLKKPSDLVMFFFQNRW